MKIILASQSPRRKEILSKAGSNFEIVVSNYEENICGLKYEDGLLLNCAYQKALEVQKRLSSLDLIISADTVVVNNGIILGKPKDLNEAYKMLESLSNKTHFVATSVCLIYGDKIKNDIEKTYVTFRKLSEDDILKYIKDEKPLDKAGSYGIQDEDFDFAIKLDGELDNVIGFPLKLFKELLELI